MIEVSKYIRDTPLECPYTSKRKFGGWPIGEAITATASHINSAINFFANRETNKANQKINEQQIEYAREAFEKEKDYNNWLLGNQRQLQMADSKSAGVNPAFVNGSSLGGVSNPAKMDVPNQIPMNYNADYSGISQGVQNALNFFLQKKAVDAQAENLYADTYKKMAETDRQRIENKYLPSLLHGQVNMIESNISVNGSVINKNEWEAKNFAQNILESNKRMQQIDEEIKVYQQQVANMKVDERIKLIEEYWKSDECKAGIESLMAAASCSRAQAQDIYATQASRIMLLDSQAQSEMERKLNIRQDTKNLKQQNRVIKITGDHIDFDLKSDKKYKNRERAMGLVNGVISSANNIVAGFKSVTGSDKAASVAGSLVPGAPPVNTGHGYTFSSSR